MSYDSSPPVYECGNAVKHDGKKRDLDSKQYKDQAKSRKEKRRMIRDTRNCRLENPETSTSKLAEAFNVSVPTARKYLSMPGQEIGAMRFLQCRQSEGVVAAAATPRLNMSSPAMRRLRRQKCGGCHRADKAKYPVLAEVGKAFHDFHAAIMGDSLEALDKFLKDYGSTTLKPFCDGIEKDVTPVKNAISFSASSGFVEGCSSKFKLLKRSLYGRAKLVKLQKKRMLAFASNDPDFSLKDLLFPILARQKACSLAIRMPFPISAPNGQSAVKTADCPLII
jgi:hypothetical protein